MIPRQHLQAIADAYDTVAEDYAKHLPDTRAETSLDLAMVQAFAAATGRHPVLDAGCGAGRMSRYLSELGCHVEGIDLSPGMVEVARRTSPSLTFGVGSVTHLPFPNAHFAGVLLWYSIIHTAPDELTTIFKEVARVLRSGGHVLVGFQSGSGTQDLSDAYRRFGHEVELHRYRHSVTDVKAQLDASGLLCGSVFTRSPENTERDDQAVILARLG